MTTQLDWFPLDIRGHLQRTAFLSTAEEGALIRAMVTSWGATLRGAPPGTIPNDDAVFARLFGADWQALMPAVRAHFHPDPERPRQLRCAWIAELYERQQQRGTTRLRRERA